MTGEQRSADTVAEMRGYLDRHLAQWGPHLAVHVDVRDLEEWLAALDHARAHGAAADERLERLTQAVDAFDTAWRAGDGDDIETCDAADVLRYELRAQREAAQQPADAREGRS